MKNQEFTPEQLEIIQLSMIALLSYVKKHDNRMLPNSFQFCERIVRNIDISRDGCYAESLELTELIRRDWRSACHFRVGLSDYYIPNDKPEIQTSMNRAISKQISIIKEYIENG